MKTQKRPKQQKPQTSEEFERFELLTKNLLSVSNAEMREKMAEVKQKKSEKKG
jgi:hypothetical protein